MDANIFTGLYSFQLKAKTLTHLIVPLSFFRPFFILLHTIGKAFPIFSTCSTQGQAKTKKIIYKLRRCIKIIKIDMIILINKWFNKLSNYIVSYPFSLGASLWFLSSYTVKSYVKPFALSASTHNLIPHFVGLFFMYYRTPEGYLDFTICPCTATFQKSLYKLFWINQNKIEKYVSCKKMAFITNKSNL